MSQEFAPLAERIVDAVLDSDPLLAAQAGDHRADGRLPDFSAGGVATEVAMLRDAETALSEVDVEALDRDEQVDHAVLFGLVDGLLFERTVLRAHEWDPLLHNPGELLHALVSRPFAPPEQRLASLASRLDALPDALATARTVLTDCPAIHLETAIARFTGVGRLIRTEVPQLVAQVPAGGPASTELLTRAATEVDAFTRWLRGRLDEAGGGTSDGAGRDGGGRDGGGRDGGGREPRLGRRLWEARLWHALDTQLPARQIVGRAWATIEQVTAELREAAAELTGGVPTDETVRRALALLAADRQSNETIVGFATATLEEATAFVREHDLVSVPEDSCVVSEMPEFARGVALAYCDSPGPLETATVPTYYCISPAPADWPAERVASLYREYNNHLIRDLTAHEAMPGHFLQLTTARGYRGTTRSRAVGRSGTFVEGWAAYAERLMTDHGFGGLPTRIQGLKMRLRTAINAVLDEAVHCEAMPESEAMALLTGVGFQEEGEAAAKWRRALLTSTQLSTYFVGYTEVSAIADARPAGTTLRRWHDAMLSHGSPAPRHVATLLGC
jgi:Bacterial protein of unknown function (DUF885)